MSKKKKSKLVLGYTRTGLAVLLPTRGAPDVNSHDGYRHVVAAFADWTHGDHTDAAHILREHGEREHDPKVGGWCSRWADAHRAIGKGSGARQVHIRGATETAIRPGKSARRR